MIEIRGKDKEKDLQKIEAQDGQDNLEQETRDLTDDEKIDIVARRILEEYREAFLELAK